MAIEQMIHRDKVLFMKKYNELLQSFVRLMGSPLHRSILEDILCRTNDKGIPLEETVTKTLNEHKSEFYFLFVEN